MAVSVLLGQPEKSLETAEPFEETTAQALLCFLKAKSRGHHRERKILAFSCDLSASLAVFQSPGCHRAKSRPELSAMGADPSGPTV